jgi:HEAT repeat protein
MAVTTKKVEKWANKKKISKLLKALENEKTEVRIAVIKALSSTKDENVMYKLIPFLKNPEASIRAITAESLGIIGNSRSQEFVRELWNTESDETVREKARLALNAIKENVSRSEKH